jgi:hypothetical protein
MALYEELGLGNFALILMHKIYRIELPGRGKK